MASKPNPEKIRIVEPEDEWIEKIFMLILSIFLFFLWIAIGWWIYS